MFRAGDTVKFHRDNREYQGRVTAHQPDLEMMMVVCPELDDEGTIMVREFEVHDFTRKPVTNHRRRTMY